MIESRLDPHVDGIGGGPEDRDLTVREVAALFRKLAVEGRARSVTAVLRILREQSKGRVHYVQYPLLPLAISLFCGLLLVAALLPPLHESWRQMVAVCSISVGILWIHGALIYRRGSQSQAQLRELHRLALEALENIVDARRFAPRPLDREDRKTFYSLRQADRAAWQRVAEVLEWNPK